MDNFVAKILKNALDPNIIGKIAIQDKNISLSYEEFANIIYSTHKFLLNKGVKKQEIIINALGNKVEQVILHYATILSGAISVPISSDLSEERLKYFLKELKAKAVFTDKDFGSISGYDIIKITSFEYLKNITKEFAEKFTIKEEFISDPKDLVSIIFTTGSTGKPKGVKLNHSCVNQALQNITNYIGYSQENKEIIPLPIYHNFGLGHVYCTHLFAGSVYIVDGIKSPKEFYNAFKSDYNATALSPSMLRILLGDRFKEKTISVFNKLKYIVINTEKLPEEITKILVKNCPNLRLMFYYGLTEGSRSFFITLSDEEEKYYSSVGKPTSDDVKVKIVNDEICIGGGHLFDGYWNQEESNIENGYFKTGDLGYIDERGYLFITGRKKDQINIGGLKISSQEIKEALIKVKGIQEVAVISIEDPITGESPAALIRASEDIEKEYIMSTLKQYLENFAIPKTIVFSDEIPKSETGKILTSKVRQIIKKEQC